jgi:hypothetical protein
VSLAQRVFFGDSRIFCAAFFGQDFCLVLGRLIVVIVVIKIRVRNDALGQAHSPAIELRFKITPLAGLFRPTG